MKLCPSRAEVRLWTERLEDRRSKKVVFLSHCLLNENTRYLGGACRRGCVEEIVQLCLERGLGMVQMPCPEQQAWGGVLKRRLLFFFGSQETLVYRMRGMLLPVLLWYTANVYRKLAKQVASQVSDYLASGFTVAAIIGVDGSPSCGVRRTLDMRRSLDMVGRLSEAARRDDMNAIVQECLSDGPGIFLDSLQKELQRRSLNVPFLAHDLIAELRGKSLAFGL